MTTQHIIDGLTFWGVCNLAVAALVGWVWLRDKLAERRFEREYRRLVAAQYKERVK